MKIDETATVRSILNALKNSNVSDVAKQIDGISKDPLASALNAAGYKYSSATPRGWAFVGDSDEPLDKSIFDFVKSKSSAKKPHSQPVPKTVTTDSHVILGQFTENEIRVIKEMLQSWQESASASEIEPTLHDRIKQLPQEEKTRKTIVIDQSIGERFDVFCEAERLNKSDILHLALADFMDKF
ncbi:hypothetical protein I2483_17820 [Sporosarcina sp. E16_3]|uniref:hypothetical protein n=1 Tax=Sporosarcina sp. E16_3 TaxID=2789293 RepID=UPI001A90E4C0|nr:hypothetical protein [Sporosarcina sp. E16_3]MBO0603527.1 hypothetical protein [Sporosarcina sp. E16_3]